MKETKNIYVHIRDKIIMPLKENRKYLHDLGGGRDFWNRTQRTLIMREKNGKLGLD